MTKWCGGKEKLNSSKNDYVNDGASKLTNILLGDTLMTVTYTLNRVPSK